VVGLPDPDSLLVTLYAIQSCHFPEGVGGRSEVAERAMDFTPDG